ncbi:hypothetical protein [Microbacterium sp. P04]|uniref:hypothetical protein n=1 Tax=Microbacterium sp. P04 TaxID=3366947 RepID=UPI0037470C18
MWAASVVLAAAIGAAATWALTHNDPTVVDTLTAAPELGTPYGYDGGGVSELIRFEDYFGLTVFTTRSPFDPEQPETQNCVFVSLGDETRGGCTTAAFDALTQLSLSGETDAGYQQLRDRFGDNAVLRFTHTGDRIVVQASNPDS